MLHKCFYVNKKSEKKLRYKQSELTALRGEK